MRGSITALAGAMALALSSAASAAVTITSSTGVTSPAPTVDNSHPVVTIDYGQLTVGPGAFSGSYTFYSDVNASANFTLDSSTTGTTFNSASLMGPGGTVLFNVLNPVNPSVWYLNGAQILAGNAESNLYTVSFTGSTNSNTTGVITGNVSLTAVPEAKTWAMMLLGFGAIGMAMRSRRRRTVLAQVA